MPLYLSMQLPEQVNTHKKCICLPDEKIYLKHFHLFASLMIYLIHPQLIRMYFLLHDPPHPRIQPPSAHHFIHACNSAARGARVDSPVKWKPGLSLYRGGCWEGGAAGQSHKCRLRDLWEQARWDNTTKTTSQTHTSCSITDIQTCVTYGAGNTA